MIATPRTQAFKKTVGVPWWEFAAKLETEIAELNERLIAAEADAAKLAVALEDIAARGRPHAGSPPGYPDGCECELCEDFDSISCALAAYETRKA